MEYNLLIPLFNFVIDSSILNIEIIKGYVIYKSEDILNNYTEFVFSRNSITKSFIRDITENGPNKWLSHPYAKYVLLKKVTIPNNNQEFYNAKEFYKHEIDKIMLTFRLISNGYCQINNFYLLANGHSAFSQLQSSSQIENICLSHRSRQNSLLGENLYYLDKSTIETFVQQYELLEKLNKKTISIPVAYLHKCYNSQTPQDRIINLAIILESTMLAGRNEELNYRLFLRTSALLGRNVKELLETFYSVRSDIIHNGVIQEKSLKKKNKKDIYDKIAKIVKLERKDNTELVFYFVKDHIEPLIRKILCTSFSILANNNTINTYEELNQQIEKFIMNKITCGFNLNDI